jgi:hypothetical protein
MFKLNKSITVNYRHVQGCICLLFENSKLEALQKEHEGKILSIRELIELGDATNLIIIYDRLAKKTKSYNNNNGQALVFATMLDVGLFYEPDFDIDSVNKESHTLVQISQMTEGSVLYKRVNSPQKKYKIPQQ